MPTCRLLWIVNIITFHWKILQVLGCQEIQLESSSWNSDGLNSLDKHSHVCESGKKWPISTFSPSFSFSTDASLRMRQHSSCLRMSMHYRIINRHIFFSLLKGVCCKWNVERYLLEALYMLEIEHTVVVEIEFFLLFICNAHRKGKIYRQWGGLHVAACRPIGRIYERWT